jgi:hypothetical protein
VTGAGEYKYYVTAKVLVGAGNFDNFFNLQLTAMYFPTSYGAVNTAPPPPPASSETESNKKAEEGRD